MTSRAIAKSNHLTCLLKRSSCTHSQLMHISNTCMLCVFIVCIHVLEYHFMHVLLIISCSLKCHDMLGIRMHSNVSLALYTKWITWHCCHLMVSPWRQNDFFLEKSIRCEVAMKGRHETNSDKEGFFVLRQRSPFGKWQPQVAT